MKNEEQAHHGTAIPPSPLPINQIPRPSKINMIPHDDDTSTSPVKQHQQEPPPTTTTTKLEESKVRIDKIDEESEVDNIAEETLALVDNIAEETLALEEHKNQYESMRSAPNSNKKKRLSSLVSSTYHLQKLLDKKRPPGPPPLPPSPTTSDDDEGEQDDSTFNDNSEQENQTVKDEQLMKQKQKYPSSVDIEKIRPSGPPPSSIIRDIAKLRQTLEAPQELRPDPNNKNNVVKMKPHSIQRKSLAKKVHKAPTTTNNDNNNLTAHTETRQKKIPPPGSLWIKCLNAENIRRKDQTSSKTNLNPYLSFKLLHQHDTTTTVVQQYIFSIFVKHVSQKYIAITAIVMTIANDYFCKIQKYQSLLFSRKNK